MENGILIIEVASSKIAFRIFSRDGKRLDDGLLEIEVDGEAQTTHRKEFDMLELINDPNHPQRQEFFDLLNHIKEQADNHGATQYYMVGTSPFRDQNGDFTQAGIEFQEQIEHMTGFWLHALNGVEECELFMQAALNDKKVQEFTQSYPDKPTLMLDMGGRSTEIALVDKGGKTVFKKDSAAFGRLSLARKSKEEVEKEVHKALATFFDGTDFDMASIGGIVYGGGLNKRIVKDFGNAADNNSNTQANLSKHAKHVATGQIEVESITHESDQITAASYLMKSIKSLAPEALVQHTTANLSKGALIEAISDPSLLEELPLIWPQLNWNFGSTLAC